MMSHTN
jgi:ferredoxin-thioredoxin reductase catalytic subunit